ncbi:MAG TPA: hypothetical protein VLJ68_07520, partial [Chitinophagaceae bacterium]|nr:hypothetical protein [Chitinophagaceae bacterium]
MRVFKLSITLLMTTLFSFALSAQKNFFTRVSENSLRNLRGKRTITPDKYQTFSLDIPAFFSFLRSLPMEQQPIRATQGLVLDLPMPDGRFSKFKVWESPVMEPGLAARFPEIRTYAGQGIDDPSATLRMDYNPYFGFSAQVLSTTGDVYIDPYSHGDIRYYNS